MYGPVVGIKQALYKCFLTEEMACQYVARDSFGISVNCLLPLVCLYWILVCKYTESILKKSDKSVIFYLAFSRV